MIVDSFHHRPFANAVSGSSQRETANVTTIEMIEVSHTRLVSGASKLILSLPMFCAREMAEFTR